MKVVRNKISMAELNEMSKKMFGGLVKAVVDIEKGIMVVDADMHADQEELLLEEGSAQENLWGINIFPDKLKGDGWIVFDSMINIRPAQENNSRSVENSQLQKKIKTVVDKLVTL